MGPRQWDDGVRYNMGDEVKYEGNRYRIVQPHTSQRDWAPNRTPALWKRLDDSDDDGGYSKKYHSKNKSYDSGDDSGDGGKSGYRKNKNKYDNDSGAKERDQQKQLEKDRQRQLELINQQQLEKDRQKQLELVKQQQTQKALEQQQAAQREREKAEQQQREQQQREQQQREQQQRVQQQQKEQQQREQQQREQQQRERDRQNEQSLSSKLADTRISQAGAPPPAHGAKYKSDDDWWADAQRRSEEFKRRGPRGPTTWVIADNGPISRDAIVAGEDNEGNPLYVARAFYQGGLHLGKIGLRGAYISYGGREIAVPKYEILLGDARAIKWISSGSKPPNARPVEGGYEANGQTLFIAQSRINRAIIPGKAWGWTEGANVGVDGKETHVTEYNILTYL